MGEDSFGLGSLDPPGDRFEKLEIVHEGFDGTVWKACDHDRGKTVP